MADTITSAKNKLSILVIYITELFIIKCSPIRFVTIIVIFNIHDYFSFSSFFYALHSRMPYGLNHYTQQQTLSLFHVYIESILHRLNDNLNIFCYNLYRVLSYYHILKYNIMNTIVHHITITPDMPIINIISGLKESKYNRKTRNSNNKTKTLINTNLLSNFFTYHLYEKLTPCELFLFLK